MPDTEDFEICLERILSDVPAPKYNPENTIKPMLDRLDRLGLRGIEKLSSEQAEIACHLDSILKLGYESDEWGTKFVAQHYEREWMKLADNQDKSEPHKPAPHLIQRWLTRIEGEAREVFSPVGVLDQQKVDRIEAAIRRGWHLRIWSAKQQEWMYLVRDDTAKKKLQESVKAVVVLTLTELTMLTDGPEGIVSAALMFSRELGATLIETRPCTKNTN